MLKTFAKIITGALLRWVWMTALGFFFSVLLAVIVLLQNADLAGRGAAGFIPLLTGMLTQNPPAFILFAGCILFILLYVLIANKVAIHTVIYEVWKNKVEGFIGDTVKNIINRLTEKSDWTTTISGKGILRDKLLEAVKTDSNSSWMKRLTLRYIFKKINLDNIDFSSPDVRLPDIMAARLNAFISNFSKPSLLLYWLLAGVQVALFIAAQFVR